MNPPAATMASMVKELRALLPLAGAAAVAILAAPHSGVAAGPVLVRVAFVWGVVMLGAHVIGHEYSHRTLAWLLTQPRGRGRLLAVKLAVLLPLVAALTLLAATAMPGDGLAPLREPGVTRMTLVLPALAAVTLAPLLSILGRGTLAATVFTIGAAGLLWLAGDVVGVLRYGLAFPRAIRAFQLWFLQVSLTGLCAAAAVGLWWKFVRLEAIDVHQALSLPDWLRSRGPTSSTVRTTPRPAVWMLVRKELHLQQIAGLVAALMATLWVGTWMAQQALGDEAPLVPIRPILAVYIGFLAICCGAVASAEERQLGTLPSQLLLPVASPLQWAIKAGTAIAVVLSLGHGLTGALSSLLPIAEPMIGMLGIPVLVTLLVTSFSLYVSSLSGSGVRAIVTAIPTTMLAMSYGAMATAFAEGVVRTAVIRAAREGDAEAMAVTGASLRASVTATMTIAAVVMIAVLLYLGYRNHRAEAPRGARLAWQSALLLLTTTTVCVLPILLIWTRL